MPRIPEWLASPDNWVKAALLAGALGVGISTVGEKNETCRIIGTVLAIPMMCFFGCVFVPLLVAFMIGEAIKALRPKSGEKREPNDPPTSMSAPSSGD